MSDQEDDLPNPNGMGRALTEFRGLYPEGGDAGNWAEHVSQTINDYTQRKAIGEANAAAGATFQSNLERFGQGLMGLVAKDPAAIDTALSLVRPTIATMVNNIPGHPQDLAQEHHDQISGDLEGSLVEAAVRSAAQQDAGVARAILDGKREMLPDGGADHLGAYIEAQQNARHLDAAATLAHADEQRSRNEQHTAWNYLGALIDPASGDFRPQPKWTQTVLNDPAVGPKASNQLIDKYGELLENGDARQSNPYILHNIAQQIASDDPPPLSQVIEQMGRGMKAADALTLAAGVLPKTDAARREYRELAATLDTARRTLAPPEAGAAGDRAFSRFVEWLMPAYRETGAGALNPVSKNAIMPQGDDHGAMLFWNHFAPRLDDIVLDRHGETIAPGESVDSDSYDRRYGLDEIFGKNKTPIGDTVIRASRNANPRYRTFDPHGVGALDEGGVPIREGGFINEAPRLLRSK